jgi:hypothetical protein
MSEIIKDIQCREREVREILVDLELMGYQSHADRLRGLFAEIRELDKIYQVNYGPISPWRQMEDMQKEWDKTLNHFVYTIPVDKDAKQDE